MPCACQKNRNAFGPNVGPNDMIPFASSESSSRYNGNYQTSAVYIVGWGTEHESLFQVNARSSARAFAKQHGLKIVKVRASRLPSDIGFGVFGS